MVRTKSKTGNSLQSNDQEMKFDAVYCQVSEVYELTVSGKDYIVEVHPITETLFKRWMKSMPGNRQKVKDYLQYKSVYPHNTHVRLRRKKGNQVVEFQGANPLALCRPIGGALMERKLHLSDEAGISRVMSPCDQQLSIYGWKIYVGEKGYYAVNEHSLRQSLACADPSGAEEAAWSIQNQMARCLGGEDHRKLSDLILTNIDFDIELSVTATRKKVAGRTSVTVAAVRSSGQSSYRRTVEAGFASDILPDLICAINTLS